jgi:PAS domain-containing protein
MPEQGLNHPATWSLDAQGFLSSILDAVAQPVWVVEHSGAILFANPVAISTLGSNRGHRQHR